MNNPRVSIMTASAPRGTAAAVPVCARASDDGAFATVDAEGRPHPGRARMAGTVVGIEDLDATRHRGLRRDHRCGAHERAERNRYDCKCSLGRGRPNRSTQAAPETQLSATKRHRAWRDEQPPHAADNAARRARLARRRWGLSRRRATSSSPERYDDASLARKSAVPTISSADAMRPQADRRRPSAPAALGRHAACRSCRCGTSRRRSRSRGCRAARTPRRRPW